MNKETEMTIYLIKTQICIESAQRQIFFKFSSPVQFEYWNSSLKQSWLSRIDQTVREKVQWAKRRLLAPRSGERWYWRWILSLFCYCYLLHSIVVPLWPNPNTQVHFLRYFNTRYMTQLPTTCKLHTYIPYNIQTIKYIIWMLLGEPDVGFGFKKHKEIQCLSSVSAGGTRPICIQFILLTAACGRAGRGEGSKPRPHKVVLRRDWFSL